MKRIARVLILILTFLSIEVVSAFAGGASRTNSEHVVDWGPVMDAIIQVESNGNPKAVSGNSVGAMQITPILVAECNKILKARKVKKRYSLKDRFSVAKSKEMFLLIQSKHNPLNNLERAIRSWNGGIHFSGRKTQRYFEKVLRAMN
ncbi:lytic transglycosylase domain-containing protein [Segatella baroniae]|uniref:lytic transglycosylase domain-containing protein n=1 Tax=Segatella baroniae TaxID=305719 RepID=UPI00046EF77D|nr:lytic transglycosylase domain-containing protein [Segatella baroniae]